MQGIIISIRRLNTGGGYWIEYANSPDGHVKHMRYIGYSKAEALAEMRRKLNIKRNPVQIRDHDKQPARPLGELLQELASYQD